MNGTSSLASSGCQGLLADPMEEMMGEKISPAGSATFGA